MQDGKRRLDGSGRMALHDHFIVRVRDGRNVTPAMVRRLAMDAGFGHSVKVVPVVPGSKAEAYYVSKYVVKSADSRRDVPWRTVDVETGELIDHEAGRYRTWSMSRAWGTSMKDIRAADRAKFEAARAESAAAEETAALGVLAATLGASSAIDGTADPP